MLVLFRRERSLFFLRLFVRFCSALEALQYKVRYWEFRDPSDFGFKKTKTLFCFKKYRLGFKKTRAEAGRTFLAFYSANKMHAVSTTVPFFLIQNDEALVEDDQKLFTFI